VCPELGGSPLFWQVTEGGAKKIWAGNEHCSDYRAALSDLALFASMINNEAAAERRYRTGKQALMRPRNGLRIP
jgi:hypothetical protein